MSKILVIGYGNPLRSDDALGWRAAEELLRMGPSDDVEVLSCRRLDPEMAGQVAKASFVIFIEACTDGAPGSITIQKMAPADKLPSLHSSSIDPYALLACARHLYGACPEALMLSVTGECFGYGKTLTPYVAAVLPGIVERVRALLAEARERHLSAAATAD